MNDMKKLFHSVVVIIVLINLSGCVTKDSDTTKSIQSTNTSIQYDKEDKADKEDKVLNIDTNEEIANPNTSSDKNNEKTFFWSEGFSIPAPKPDSNYIVPNDFGVMCYEFSKEQLLKYLVELESTGWVCSSKSEILGKINYTYVKGDMNLQIIDNTKEIDNNELDNIKEIDNDELGNTKEIDNNVLDDTKELDNKVDNTKENEYSVSINDSILVYFTNGNEKMNQRKDSISKLEALDLIEARIKELNEIGVEVPFNSNSTIAMIIERFVEDSYEKMGVQAFSAVSENGNLVGNFLICNRFVLPVLDNLAETSIVDIDADGEYELLSLYGWGSGIYRIEINAYKNVNPIYFSSNTKILQLCYRNCFVPKGGYGKLLLNKISDNEIRLLDHDWKAEDSGKVNEEPKDYGKIILDTDGFHLIPENQDNFPYDQWDYAYDQSNLSKKNLGIDQKTNQSLQEPPEIKITIGDKKLVYDTIKINWNGEESREKFSFGSIMANKETIPVFDNPGNMLEFKDTILLDFGDIIPDSIEVKDYLLMDDGGLKYNEKIAQDRAVRIEDDGTFTFGLYQHMALSLSSSMLAYEKPSYRGFRVICTFGDKVCEYIFVLGLGPFHLID
jgi:hypothetical protein